MSIEKSRLHERVDNDFRYHAPSPEQVPLYETLRSSAKDLAHLIVESVPVGREQSTALTLLEQAVMVANAGIARSGP